MENKVQDIRARFVDEWGALGSAWGINRSMASLHARLLVSSEPMSMDDLMAELSLSRGNTSTNLRDLVSWGLVRQVVVRGERKQFFVAEKEPWKVFVTILRERLHREIDPAVDTLGRIAQASEGLPGKEGQELHRVVKGLHGFLLPLRAMAHRVVGAESKILSAISRVL